jgi:hypothetical protein
VGGVEGDAQVDVDVPACDGDVVDDEAQQSLALGEPEGVDADGRTLGEAVEALA